MTSPPIFSEESFDDIEMMLDEMAKQASLSLQEGKCDHQVILEASLVHLDTVTRMSR